MSKKSFIFRDPEKVLEALDVNEAKWWVDVLLLFGFFFAFRIGAYFVLRWKVRSQR